MDKLFLSLIRKLDFILLKAGVNTDQLHEILRIKLIMDNRRPRTLFAKKSSNTSNVSSPWMISLGTIVLGVLLSILLFFGDSPLSSHTFYFTAFMVLMCMTLVSDFTTVLIDTRDQFILLPRPVDDRTIAVSRILHITIYVLRLALIQGLPGIILVGVADKNAFACLVMLVEVLEATFLSILIVNLIYLAMMRSVSAQRFKDIVSYFQIAFSTLIFATYYLLPRLVDIKVLKGISLVNHTWAWFLPPVWISALNEVLIHPNRINLITALLALAGFVIPVIGMWFVIKVLAPGFNQKLAVLATSEGNTAAPTKVTTINKADFRDKLGAMVASDPVENAGFSITWKLASRMREFKLKTYPSFALVPIMFLYFTLTGKGLSVGEKMSRLQQGSSYVFLMYASIIVLSTLLTYVTQSEKFKAGWVYYALPVGQPGKILSGMFKALIWLYYLPFCIILGAGIIIVWGPQAINDVLLGFLICIIYGILLALFAVKGLPFSKPVLAKQSGGRTMGNLLTMGLLGILGYGHFAIMNYEKIIWALIIPVAAVVWIMLVQYKKTTWDDLESYEEGEAIAKPKKVKTKPLIPTQ